MSILTSHFLNKPPTPSTQGAGWKALWETGQNHLWDRGRPSPALIEFLERHKQHLPKPISGLRPTALIPACGKGYDVPMLALHGFEVWGLEISPRAVEIARQYAKEEMANPREFNFDNDSAGVQPNDTEDIGSIQLICGDFFAEEWNKAGNILEVPHEFDLIYDFTFLCALPPILRSQWSKRMNSLLSANGILVCLEFPLYKHLDEQGPPWGLSGVHWDLLAEGGDGILTRSESSAPAEPVSTAAEAEAETVVIGKIKGSKRQKGAFERVLYYTPTTQVKPEKGRDMISVWKKIG